jgi:hypothetical protein
VLNKEVTPIKDKHFDKNVILFAAKNISEASNVKYSASIIFLIFISASYEFGSINAKAIYPNPDTVFYRICGSISKMENQMLKLCIEHLIQKRRKYKKQKNYLVVDETYDSYTGKLLRKEKKHKNKLSKAERYALKYLHFYKPKKGDTGSYKYLVISLVSGNKRRVLIVKALKRKEKYKKYIITTLLLLKTVIDFKCVLFDRGFYDGAFVEELKANNLPFILRARISKTMKKEYGFYLEWKCYTDFEIGNNGKGNLILGVESISGKRMKWAFITNMKFVNWYETRVIYRKRWNIENIFKATDGIQLRAQTSNPTTRMFCVCFSFLLYNAWQAKNKRKHITLANFILACFEKTLCKIVRLAKTTYGCFRDKLKLKINVPFWDRIIASFS